MRLECNSFVRTTKVLGAERAREKLNYLAISEDNSQTSTEQTASHSNLTSTMAEWFGVCEILRFEGTWFELGGVRWVKILWWKGLSW